MGKELLGSLELNRAYQMDCLEGMKLIPDKSINMILCDLPYAKTANLWDTIIPLDDMWEQYNRIITDNGTIALTAMQPFTSMLVMSNYKMFKYELVWCKDKPTGFQIAKIKPMTKHENVLIFSKSKTIYNPQFWESKPMNTVYKRGGDKSNSVAVGIDRIDTKQEDLNTTKRYPTTLLQINTVNNNSKEKVKHPTQKPVKLFEWLINTYSNENDIVLDNCLGSGTTAVACELNNRKWVGFETESKYIEIINKRLDSIQLEDDLKDYE